jgi:hypothetical protein
MWESIRPRITVPARQVYDLGTGAWGAKVSFRPLRDVTPQKHFGSEVPSDEPTSARLTRDCMFHDAFFWFSC